MKLTDGGTARVELEIGTLRLPVLLDPRQAAGVALVPRIRGSATGHLIPGSGAMPCRISAEEER